MKRQIPRIGMMATTFWVLSAAALLNATAHAQGAASDASEAAFEPDRPGFTNGSGITPVGRVVVESGIARTRDQSSQGGTVTIDGPEALIRIGAGKNLEYQIGLPNYNKERHGERGFGDAYLGLKIKVYESGDGNTRASIAPGFTLPVGERAFSTRHVDPVVTLGADHQAGHTTFAANLVFSDADDNGGGSAGGGGRNFTVTPAASISYSVTDKLSVYGDAFADLPSHGTSQTTCDGGFTYLLKPDVQLDIEAGRGLAGEAPANFVGAGVSFRF